MGPVSKYPKQLRFSLSFTLKPPKQRVTFPATLTKRGGYRGAPPKKTNPDPPPPTCAKACSSSQAQAQRAALDSLASAPQPGARGVWRLKRKPTDFGGRGKMGFW